MCLTAFFKDPRCGCKWTAIVQPCFPGYGFSTCPCFFNGVVKEAPRYFKARKMCCPKHDLCGIYDRNLIRMVVKIQGGLKWGLGPNADDPGIEFRCSVM